MGLRDGHPEKEGVLIDLKDIVEQVQQRLQRKENLRVFPQITYS